MAFVTLLMFAFAVVGFTRTIVDFYRWLLKKIPKRSKKE